MHPFLGLSPAIRAIKPRRRMSAEASGVSGDTSSCKLYGWTIDRQKSSHLLTRLAPAAVGVWRKYEADGVISLHAGVVVLAAEARVAAITTSLQRRPGGLLEAEWKRDETRRVGHDGAEKACRWRWAPAGRGGG